MEKKNNISSPLSSSLDTTLSISKLINTPKERTEIPNIYPDDNNLSVNDNIVNDINMIVIPENYKDGTSDLAQSLNDLLTSQISQTSGQINMNTAYNTNISSNNTNNYPNMNNNYNYNYNYSYDNTNNYNSNLHSNNMNNQLSFQIFNTDISTSPYSISSVLCNGDINNSPSKTFKIPKSSIPHIKLSKFSLPDVHMEYLKLFYDNFSRVIMPLCPLGLDDETETENENSQSENEHSENKTKNNNNNNNNKLKNYKNEKKDKEDEDNDNSSIPLSPSTAGLNYNSNNYCNNNIINPARDFILYYARRESYVLAAVLACGALSAYRHSKSPIDEAKYCNYLSTCMSLLGQSLNEETSSIDKDKKKKNGKMEGMIMTTLLLTSYNASSNVVKWRPHLETAGRLLIHSSWSNKNNRNDDDDNDDSNQLNIIERETLAFCRTWFFSIEIIAGISSNLGGTMNEKDWEIVEEWVNDDSNLLRISRINWVNPINDDTSNNNNETIRDFNQDFNLMLGYSNKLTIITGRLCCILKNARLGKKITLNEISWFLTSLESKEVKEYCILSNTAYLNEDFQYDPKYGIPIEAIEKFDDIESNGKIVYLSWWDICYQAHRMSTIIQVLTQLMKLDKNHFLVKNAIEETIELLKFLKTKKRIKSFELMMFQFCVFLVGKWTTKIEDRKLVSKYFRDLHDFGNIGSLYSMQKLERIWRNESDENEEDIINY